MPDPLVRAHDGWVLQLEKADPRVDYKMAAAGDTERCGTCRYYSPLDMSCNLVEGSISSDCTCDLWTAQLSSGMAWSDKDRRFQVFVEVPQGFAEVNPWIPFLPKPGKFKHPLYGEIEITPESNQAFVDSITNRIYQDHIPIDAEHETKLSGAVAWIQGARLNSDGSADAYVEWTDRGKSLVEGGGYKYVSPEWYDHWEDPSTQVVHHNVIVGGAITTRPFFKELSLRALVASEKGVTIISKEERTVADKDPKVPEVPKTYAEGSPELQALIDQAKTEATKDLFTEEQVNAKVEEAKTATEPKNEPKAMAELNERLTAAEGRATAAEEVNKTLTKSITEIRNESRHQRFTELVAGRGGANDGGAWVGDASTHVAFLEKLSDQFGENDEMVTKFIESQNAIAAQFHEADLFKEVGTSTAPGGSNPESKLESMTQARMKEDPKKSYAKAYSEVLESPEGAKLYAELNAPKRA